MAIGLRLTLEQFLERPEEKPALEFDDGVVTQKAWPGTRHSRLQGASAGLLGTYAEPRRLAMAFIELRCTFAGHSLVPDVAVIRWDRLGLDEKGQLDDEEYLQPPDLAIEILSPEQAPSATAARCRWYVDNGVSLSLSVDPDGRAVSAFRPGQPEQVLASDEPIDFAPVLPGFTLTPAEIFAALTIR